MYEHYKAYCTANELQPVNSATFGKLLRVVFPDLKTRRLGVRGQSKYHYCGIRVRNEDEVIM
jgi:phage/plasmid-associated DNA primase